MGEVEAALRWVTPSLCLLVMRAWRKEGRREVRKEREASVVVSNLMYGLIATQGKGVAFCTVGCDK